MYIIQKNRSLQSFFRTLFFKIIYLPTIIFLSFLKPFLPRNRLGDKIISFYKFIKNHKRLPSKNLIFNDVLYQLKTTDEILDPLRVFVFDKEFVKLYVKAILGDEYNVPTIAVLRSIEEVDSFDFPANCCIKPTQASGKVILRRDGEKIDKETIKRWFSINYYNSGREANYKILKPKIVIEPLIFNSTNAEDYRFFCFNGKVKLILLDIDIRHNRRRGLFDKNWKKQNFSLGYPKVEEEIPAPKNLANMISAVERLAQYFDFIRIDLYSDGNRFLIGEITNCHASASQRFIPETAELEASKIIFNS